MTPDEAEAVVTKVEALAVELRGIADNAGNELKSEQNSNIRLVLVQQELFALRVAKTIESILSYGAESVDEALEALKAVQPGCAEVDVDELTKDACGRPKQRLRPCPFCGAKEIRILPQPYGYSIDCIVCGAMVKEHSRYKKGVVARWNNRRAEEPTVL